jgi:hypothetical protein
MTLHARDLVARLLDATPVIPVDADVDQLLTSFEEIIARRAAIIALISPPITLSEIDRPLLIELERRQNLWHEALATALRTVGERRCGATRLRAYAGSR